MSPLEKVADIYARAFAELEKEAIRELPAGTLAKIRQIGKKAPKPKVSVDTAREAARKAWMSGGRIR